MSTVSAQPSESALAPTEPAFGFKFVAPLALGSMLNPINSSLISTAIVPIGQAFHASTAQTGWLIAGLYLASSVAQPTMGRFADLLGPRRVFLGALLVVALAGIAGMFAPSLEVLIATRVLIGIGTSGAYPAAMRMFRDRGEAVGGPPPRTAMGVLSMSSLSVVAVGPFLGGVLTSHFGWHAVFAVNFPLALAAMGLVLAWAPQDATPPGGLGQVLGGFDLVGLELFSVFLVSLMVFLMSLAHPLWPALPVAVGAGAAFAVWSLRKPEPFIDLRMLIDNRPLSFTYLRIASIMTLAYCMFYGLVQWLQSAAGLSSSQAGLVTVPMSVIAAVSSFMGARTRSIRTPFVISTATALIGSLSLFCLDHTSPLWLIGLAVGFFGFPLGMTSTATQAAVYLQAPPDKIGTASGLQRTAGYLGSIASASLLALSFGKQASDSGFHALTLVMTIISAVLLLAVCLDPTLPKPETAGEITP